jgi:hypothetical protein
MKLSGGGGEIVNDDDENINNIEIPNTHIQRRQISK